MEIEQQYASGESLRYTCPLDMQGCHSVMDCIRAIKLDTWTANYPKAKENPKWKIGGVELDSEEGKEKLDSDSSESRDSKESSDCKDEGEVSKGEPLEQSEEDVQQEVDGNWLDS